jgi:DNA polymerase III subunit delta'
MSWSSIIGQSRAKQILIASYERNRIAHAYIFVGADGSGKYAMAIELAKVVNCDHGGVDACDGCSHCKKIAALQHPDVRLIFPLPVGKSEKSSDGPLAKLAEDDVTIINGQMQAKALNPYHQIIIPKASIIKVNSIRDIRRESAYTPVGGKKKIFIILDAEKMNDEAANALLKTLEEPHPDTILILTSANPAALLPTIISRCQQLRFDPLSEDEIAKALIDRTECEANLSLSIARLASGSYTRALQYLGTSLQERKEFAVELLRIMLLRPRTQILTEIEKLTAGYQKNDLKDILQLLQQWLHDVMLTGYDLVANTAQKDIESMKKFLARYTEWDYIAASEAIERAISLLDKNVYIPLIIMNLATAMKDHIRTQP